MHDRYISRERLLVTLTEYKNLKLWNTGVCDSDTILRVLEVVENLVNNAPTIGQKQIGNELLQAKNAALKFHLNVLIQRILQDEEEYRRFETIGSEITMGFYKGKITAEEQTRNWLETMVRNG